MQVSIAFAESFAVAKPYPYPLSGTIRHEVFTRRGGMYFGVAHLLDYPASYTRPLYRFADFNAGQYASRNAAFQSAVSAGVRAYRSSSTATCCATTGDVPVREPGSTESATRVLGRRIDMSNEAIRRDLERGRGAGFEETRLYVRVFELADRVTGKPAPRAVVPQIPLHSPKITRNLTTDWFARRVEARYQSCLQRASGLTRSGCASH